MMTTDYLYCEDCGMFVDLWKYGHNLKDCGHEGCHWRFVTKEELQDCVKACEREGCFDEVIL